MIALRHASAFSYHCSETRTHGPIFGSHTLWLKNRFNPGCRQTSLAWTFTYQSSPSSADTPSGYFTATIQRSIVPSARVSPFPWKSSVGRAGTKQNTGGCGPLGARKSVVEGKSVNAGGPG